MNLSINPAVQNYNSMNCQRKNTPNFGMAIKVDKSAMPVIKKQVMNLTEKAPKKGVPSESAYNKFWENFNSAVKRQEENPVNIIVRKTKMRDGLTAVVVDSTAETAVKNQKFSQGLFSKNGSLKFLDKAENSANKINDANNKLGELTVASKADYKAGTKPYEPTYSV